MSAYGRIVDEKPTEIINHGKTGVNCIVWPVGKVWGRYAADNINHEPAGILQLSIQTRESSHVKLKSFTMGIVYVDDTTGVGTMPRPTDQVWNICEPVPEYIEGQHLSRDKTRGGEFGPELDVGVGSGRIGSYNRSTSYTGTRAWSFRARNGYLDHLLTSSASWSWRSNPWDHDDGVRGTLYGGLAFRYQRPTIKIKCFVEGKKKGRMPWRTKLVGEKSCTVQTDSKDSDLRDVVAGLKAFFDDINTRPTAQVAPPAVPQPSAAPAHNLAAFNTNMQSTTSIPPASPTPSAPSTIPQQPVNQNVPDPSNQPVDPAAQASTQQTPAAVQPTGPLATTAAAPVTVASRNSQIPAMQAISSSAGPKLSPPPVMNRPSRVATN